MDFLSIILISPTRRPGLALVDLNRLGRGLVDMRAVAVWRVHRRRVARAPACGGLSPIARMVYKFMVYKFIF